MNSYTSLVMLLDGSIFTWNDLTSSKVILIFTNLSSGWHISMPFEEGLVDNVAWMLGSGSGTTCRRGTRGLFLAIHP